MAFPLDTTSVHSLTTSAVRLIYWSPFSECHIHPEDDIQQFSFELSNIFTYEMTEIQKLEFCIRHRLQELKGKNV